MTAAAHRRHTFWPDKKRAHTHMYAREYKPMLIRTPIPSAAAVPAAATAAAPWRALFLEHLAQMPAPLGAVSTVHPVESGSASGSRAATPRVRNCVCRGLWGSLPDNARNPAPRNPADVYESDLPVFTTDVRMAKAWELSASGSGSGSGSASASTAGGHGGGPIEAVWWAAAAGTQWRVRGRAWLLGPDVEGEGGATAREAVCRRMRYTATGEVQAQVQAQAQAQDWSWAREVTGHFGNMSPDMRGSFRNPAPGTARLDGGLELGKPVDDDDLENAEARANFRVCVIVPEEVDQTDLSRGDDPRRWLYTYVGAGGQAVHEGGVVEGGWEKLEVWP